MLRNCDKITTPISSSTNQWPLQNQKLDDRKGFMASSSVNNKVIMAENSNNQAQDPLKCPRCDSSNTKFCYYNNYSLSQPRHFCKACKRYWTRGGTLRNVPVGGGCRKNKRVKRHHSSSDGVNTSSAASTNPTSVTPPQIDLMSSATTNHINSNPMFYNPLELNFPFSNFRVSSEHTGFDLQPQMSNLGLGFSSSGQLPLDEYKNGFKQNIQDVFNGSGNDSILFGSSAFGSSSTMASLLASSLQQHKFSSTFKDIQAANYSPNLMPSEDSGSGNGAPNKEMKVEGGNRMVWNPSPDPNPNSNPIEQINNSSDPSSLLWNTTNVSAWFDPSNMGSSVPSLI